MRKLILAVLGISAVAYIAKVIEKTQEIYKEVDDDWFWFRLTGIWEHYAPLTGLIHDRRTFGNENWEHAVILYLERVSINTRIFGQQITKQSPDKALLDCFGLQQGLELELSELRELIEKKERRGMIAKVERIGELLDEITAFGRTQM